MKALPYYIIFQMPVGIIMGYVHGGVLNFMTLAMLFVIIPLLDFFIGITKINPDPEEERRLKDSLPHKIVTWLAVPVQVGMVIWGAFTVAHGRMSTLEFVGFTLSMGCMSGIMGINLSHELMHRVNNRFEVLLSRIMLWTTGYMHWAIEHVAGHHRNVATPEDPATARSGESFYSFWPRTVIGGFTSSWNIEKKRLGRKGIRIWSSHNRIIRYTTAELALLLVFWVLLGPLAAVYFIIQCLVAISLLEVVNYIEHYGLLRRELREGVYEPVNVTHSWNSGNILTNVFLFNLQRHSDHHAEPNRRYPVLRYFEESPQLPTGYAGMMILALIPPLWRKVMDQPSGKDKGIKSNIIADAHMDQQ
ncbi:MAG: alkane 1-monooxygenase [Proteobacteria bacterium]|nr:alkane 1-monooxygenase [Pseudomonadota bacterium]